MMQTIGWLPWSGGDGDISRSEQGEGLDGGPDASETAAVLYAWQAALDGREESRRRVGAGFKAMATGRRGNGWMGGQAEPEVSSVLYGCCN